MNWIGFGLLAAVAWTAQGGTGFDWNRQGAEAAARGDYTQAEALYGKAIEAWRAAGPADEERLSVSLFNLGQARQAAGKREAAAQAYEQSLAIDRRLLGTDHLETLRAMNCLAGVYFMMGDTVRAGALFEEALPVLRERYPTDIQLARDLAGLASLRLSTGSPAQATPLADEALSLTLKLEGEDSVDAAIAYATVAAAHMSALRPERAEPLYRKAIAIYERVLGPANPRTASVRSQEALVLMTEGKLTLAEKEAQQAAADLERSCPDCYTDLWTAESNLGVIRFRLGNFQDADRLFTHVLEIQENLSPRPVPGMADTLRALAVVRLKEKRYEDAARLNRQAASITGFR